MMVDDEPIQKSGSSQPYLGIGRYRVPGVSVGERVCEGEGDRGVAEEAKVGGEEVEAGSGCGSRGDEGQAHDVRGAAHEVKDGLDGSGIGLPEVGLEEGTELALYLPGFDPVILEGGADHGSKLGRRLVGGNADESLGADFNGSEGEVVVTGEDLELMGQGMDELGNLGQLSAGFLDGLDVGRGLGKPEDSCGIEVDSGAAGNVIEGYRNGIDSSGEGEEVLELAFLSGLVVVGIGGENGIDAANLTEKCGEAEQGAGAVVSASGPNRNAACCSVHNYIDGEKPLVLIEGGGFAGGTASHQKVDSRFNLPVDERAQRLLVDCSIRLERRDYCRSATCRFHHR
jgi:hypothetical protein